MLTDAVQLPTLHGQRVRLRWLLNDDVADLFRIFSHPDVARFWSEPAMTEHQQAQALFDSVQDYFRNRTLFQWGIERLQEDGIIGTCTLASLDAKNRRTDIGYALNRDFWGRGLVSDALTTLLRFAFESLNMHRIEADVDPRNDRSIKVLERQGFRREGYLRERWFVDGQVADTAMFGLLRREWTGDPGDTQNTDDSQE